MSKAVILREPKPQEIAKLAQLQSNLKEVVAECIRSKGVPPSLVAAALALELGHVVSFIELDVPSPEQEATIIREMVFQNLMRGQQQAAIEREAGIHPYMEAAADSREYGTDMI